jgi:hypothetical protein
MKRKKEKKVYSINTFAVAINRGRSKIFLKSDKANKIYLLARFYKCP